MKVGGIVIAALTLAQGLIALKAYRVNALAWVAGVVAFVITVAIAGHDLFLRNEIAFLAGSVVVVIGVGSALLAAMRRSAGTLEDLVEVVEHEALEI